MLLVWLICLSLSLFQWSESRRFDIAGQLSSVLTSHLNAYDPILSLTLRYLIRSLLLSIGWYVVNLSLSGSSDFTFQLSDISHFTPLFFMLYLCCAVYTRGFASVKEFHHLYQILLKGCFLRNVTHLQCPRRACMKHLHLMRSEMW